MDFNVGDMVEVISSVREKLIGEIADVIFINESEGCVYVRFINPALHTYHGNPDGVFNTRVFSADKLLPIEMETVQVSEEDLMRVLGVIT